MRGAGTYVRTVAIDALVDDFLSSNGITPGSSEEEEQWAVEEQKGGKQGMKVQILSLGAGTDTRFFRLQQRYGRRLARRLHYHELDFPSTARRKIDAIERASWVGRLLRDAADEAVADTTSRRQDHTGDKSPVRINADKTSLTSPAYTFHALDLRRLSESTVDPADLLSDVEPNVPTLILSECCLTYLPITTANAILARLARFLQPSAPAPPSQSSQMSNAQHSQAPSSPAKAVPNPGKQPHHCPDHTLAVLLYEPLHPADAFGRTMHSNLAARGISLPSLEALPTLEAHQTRLRSVLGAPEGEFSGIKFPGEERSDGGMSEAKGAQGAVSVRRWWEREVSEGERERLRRCEGLDEEEEWELLAEHYGFVWGWRGGEVGGRWFVCGEEGDGGR